MSAVTTTKCDQCGSLKRESNHWYKVARYRPGYFAIAVSGCCILPEEDDVMGLDDACGLECVNKLLNRHLQADRRDA